MLRAIFGYAQSIDREADCCAVKIAQLVDGKNTNCAMRKLCMRLLGANVENYKVGRRVNEKV